MLRTSNEQQLTETQGSSELLKRDSSQRALAQRQSYIHHFSIDFSGDMLCACGPLRPMSQRLVSDVAVCQDWHITNLVTQTWSNCTDVPAVCKSSWIVPWSPAQCVELRQPTIPAKAFMFGPKPSTARPAHACIILQQDARSLELMRARVHVHSSRRPCLNPRTLQRVAESESPVCLNTTRF